MTLILKNAWTHWLWAQCQGSNLKNTRDRNWIFYLQGEDWWSSSSLGRGAGMHHCSIFELTPPTAGTWVSAVASLLNPVPTQSTVIDGHKIWVIVKLEPSWWFSEKPPHATYPQAWTYFSSYYLKVADLRPALKTTLKCLKGSDP